MTKPTFPFTLQGLHDWLETQDPSTEYDYTDPQDCLLCRFLRDTGNAREPWVDPMMWSDSLTEHTRSFSRYLPSHVNEVSNGVLRSDWTYGAALARAKELLA